MTRVAVLGAGHVGPVIARVAIEAGYRVAIAASTDPERIALIVRVMAPGAEARWAADAVDDSDVVVLAIPIHRFAASSCTARRSSHSSVGAWRDWPPALPHGGCERVLRAEHSPGCRRRTEQSNPWA